jgi:hypothetical protein
MVKVPAGIFLMGSPAFRSNEEETPAHEAVVASFYLDRTEVTLAAYRTCVAAGRCPAPRTTVAFCNAKYTDREEHPVNCIDWYDAKAYCAFAGGRLPTEREWEYAAGGGSEHRPFSWGDAEPSAKLACYDHPFGSCPVASYEPGAFGLYDVSGNVWEWTSSAFKPYPSSPSADEPSKENWVFVYRGGSWSRRFPKWLRTTLRNRVEPSHFHASLGVRCARTVEPLECPPDTEPREGACARVRGVPGCEEGFGWDGTQCSLDGGLTPAQVLSFAKPAVAPSSSAPSDPAQLGVPQQGSDAVAVGSASVTRTRTSQYDADCNLHWPGKPVSYLFKGGRFHDRRPLLSASGCSPRDVATSWTSACCPQ